MISVLKFLKIFLVRIFEFVCKTAVLHGKVLHKYNTEIHSFSCKIQIIGISSVHQPNNVLRP